MGAFNSAVITKKGQGLLAKVVSGACDLEFTQIKTSEKTLSRDLASLTDIGTVKQAEKVASIVKQNEYNVKVSTSFSNKGLTTGYYVRNIGLYAMDPQEGEILYSISVADESIATADWMPPYNGTCLSSLMVDLITAVSNASSVNILVDPTATATVAQIMEVHEHLSALENSITTTTEETLSGSVAGVLKVNKVVGKCGQEADPTPNVPQEIKSVVVSEIMAHGKNLLENTATDKTINGVKFTVNGDKSVTVKNTATEVAVFTIGNITLQSGITYVCDSSVSDIGFSLRTHGGGTVIHNFAEANEFTPTEDVTCDVCIRVGSGVTVNNTVYPMIRHAHITNGTYEPYTENSITLSQPITLSGVKEAGDELTPAGVVRRIAKVTLNGTESWNKHAKSEIYPDGINAFHFYFARGQVSYKDSKHGLFTHFKTGAVASYGADMCAFVGTDTIQIRYDAISTVEELRAWLSANPVEVYYHTTATTVEELPVEDQIALRSLLSYDEVTCVSTDAEISPVIEVEYGTNKLGAHALTGLLKAERNEIKLAELTS